MNLMRAMSRRRSLAVAATGLLLAGGSSALLPSSAQATDDGTVASVVGDVIPNSWRFDSSMTTLAQAKSSTGADIVARMGWNGEGVGVALVDTGVVPVPGLTSGNVVDGPDLSFDSQVPALTRFDAFGHGTHMAGIIVGNDTSSRDGFKGVAPGAKLTSVKVGSSDGAADVSQVIAAIDWVVAHRNDDPQNPIRVLNLSYGTDGVQDYQADPLVHAVENAWRAGIVVVVAGGNTGFGGESLNNPAYDPYVIAVGAADLMGTLPALDDTVADFSSRGDSARRVDLVAPGKSIASLRDPGSYVDAAYPGARVGDQLFKGSGTSQATAFVSGAVAQLLEQRPQLTPDQVKALLKSTATPLLMADAAGRGAGEINVLGASLTRAPSVTQSYPRSQGTGSLEAARGTQHVSDNGTPLTGENDIFQPWPGAKWAAASSNGTAWDGGRWMGVQWTGDCWCATTWAGKAWSGNSWGGNSWGGNSWGGNSWGGNSWGGNSWGGNSWGGNSWGGNSWGGNSWGGNSWGGNSWGAAGWS